MFNLLRKKRRKSIQEDERTNTSSSSNNDGNIKKRTSNYLFYASGEILLVVIGILVALQINNMNEANSNKKYIKTYLQKIDQNISSDLQEIRKLYLSRERTSALCDSVLKHYEKRKFDNSEVINNAFFGVFIEKKFNKNASAFESLKSSGFMKNFKKPELEAQLNQYYLMQEELLFVEEKLNQYTQQVEEKLSDKGFYIEHQDVFDQRKANVEPFTYESFAKYPNIQSAFIRSRLFIKEILENYSIVMEQGRSIQSNIASLE